MKLPKTVADYIRFCRRVCENTGWIVVRYNGQFGYFDSDTTEYHNLYFHNLEVMFPGKADLYACEDEWQALAGRNADDIDTATSGIRSDEPRIRWIRQLLQRCLAAKRVYRD